MGRGKWSMSMEHGWEELTIDEDLSAIIAAEIEQKFLHSASSVDGAELDLELLDLKVTGYVAQIDSIVYKTDHICLKAAVPACSHFIRRAG